MPIRLLYSARSLDDVIYRDELMRFAAFDEIDIRLSLTQASPSGWRGHRGRVDQNLLEAIVWAPEDQPTILVCGPTGFVDAIVGALAKIGHRRERIRTERCTARGC